MSDYTNRYDAAVGNNDTLFKQVSYAVKKAAHDVSQEDPGTTNHAERLEWSRKVSLTNNGPSTEARRMIWRVLDNATIQAAIGTDGSSTASDSDVQFTVNALIDEFALG